MFANRLVSLFVSDVSYDHYSALDKKGKKCENGAQWVWNGLTDHILIHICWVLTTVFQAENDQSQT